MDHRIGGHFLKVSQVLEVVVLKNILNLVYLCQFYGLEMLWNIGMKRQNK